jgi:hypothetical protein
MLARKAGMVGWPVTPAALPRTGGGEVKVCILIPEGSRQDRPHRPLNNRGLVPRKRSLRAPSHKEGNILRNPLRKPSSVLRDAY